MAQYRFTQALFQGIFGVLATAVVLHIPQQGPYGERCSVSRDTGLSIHLYLSESPLKKLSHEMEGKHSHHPRTPTWTEGLHTIQWGATWFHKGLLTTLLSLPQCHAAFSRYFPPWFGQARVPLTSVS